MKNMHSEKTHSQKGNALFLILIAMALFAALSYAVAQSGRGSGTIDRESDVISSGQITQYSSLVQTTLLRMITTGTVVSTLDFSPGSGTTKVFDTASGGMVAQSPPSNIGPAMGGTTGTTLSSWGYKDALDPALGYYVLNIGSNNSPSGREIFAYLHDINQPVCQQILRGLGLAMTPPVNGATFDYASNGGKGLNTGAIAASTNTFDALPGHAFACVNNGGKYDYYHAVVEQ